MEGMSPERYKELYGSKPKSQLGQPDESAEQIQLFTWASFQSGKYPCLALLFHIPNGGKRTQSAGGKLKAEGMRAGVPDICLPVARGGYHGLFIELKVKGGKPSVLQKQWLGDLTAQGYKAVLCYGYDEAQDTILNYIKGAG